VKNFELKDDFTYFDVFYLDFKIFINVYLLYKGVTNIPVGQILNFVSRMLKMLAKGRHVI
jgi:hypothetical protein